MTSKERMKVWERMAMGDPTVTMGEAMEAVTTTPEGESLPPGVTYEGVQGVKGFFFASFGNKAAFAFAVGADVPRLERVRDEGDEGGSDAND